MKIIKAFGSNCQLKARHTNANVLTVGFAFKGGKTGTLALSDFRHSASVAGSTQHKNLALKVKVASYCERSKAFPNECVIELHAKASA